MALPAVAGWIIDFRTADTIFLSGSNVKIDHCLGLCQGGLLHICHCEEDRFRGSAHLKAPFITSQCCIFEPDDDILQRCMTVGANPIAANLVTGNEAAIFITATALSKSLGVISDHFSLKFATVRDLCDAYGVPNFSADEYFAELP